MNNVLVEEMNDGESVLLVGPPGIGKTGRFFTAAMQCGFEEIIVSRVSLAERTDYAGCYVPDIAAGVTRALPLDMLHSLETTTKKTLLFLDDFGQGPTDVQSATMSLFDKGKLSPTVLICAATNRPQDRAGVNRLHEAMRSRFSATYVIPTPDMQDSQDGGQALGTWEDELNGWIDWAFDNNAPAEVIAWIRTAGMRKERNPLYNWKSSADPSVRFPDYRNWERVIMAWNRGYRSHAKFAARIGKPAAAEFLQFARLADQLPTPDQVWMDPMGAPIPHDASALYLVTSILVSAAKPQYAEAAVQYMERISKEAPNGRVYSALMAKDLQRKLGATLNGTRAWTSWFHANKQLFEVS